MENHLNGIGRAEVDHIGFLEWARLDSLPVYENAVSLSAIFNSEFTVGMDHRRRTAGDALVGQQKVVADVVGAPDQERRLGYGHTLAGAVTLDDDQHGFRDRFRACHIKGP